MDFFFKWPFFRADMAGLGIYHMGGFGRIGVYRVNTDQATKSNDSKNKFFHTIPPG